MQAPLIGLTLTGRLRNRSGWPHMRVTALQILKQKSNQTGGWPFQENLHRLSTGLNRPALVAMTTALLSQRSIIHPVYFEDVTMNKLITALIAAAIASASVTAFAADAAAPAADAPKAAAPAKHHVKKHHVKKHHAKKAAAKADAPKTDAAPAK